MSMELIDRDKTIRIAEQGQVKGFEWQFAQLTKEPTVEAIPKDQYETRLKAEMVDMLLDVQNEIKQKELEAWGYPNIEYSKGLKLTVDIIQKKICALKEK